MDWAEPGISNPTMTFSNVTRSSLYTPAIASAFGSEQARAQCGLMVSDDKGRLVLVLDECYLAISIYVCTRHLVSRVHVPLGASFESILPIRNAAQEPS